MINLFLVELCTGTEADVQVQKLIMSGNIFCLWSSGLAALRQGSRQLFGSNASKEPWSLARFAYACEKQANSSL